jgi:cation diffusion facilitator CzcD-associated flavoprotein CzcO
MRVPECGMGPWQQRAWLTRSGSLKEKWQDGPRTLLGTLVDGFPNFMMAMGPHAGLGNFPRAVEYTSDWITALIRFARERGLTRIDATPEAVATWTDHVIETNEG